MKTGINMLSIKIPENTATIIAEAEKPTIIIIAAAK